MLKGLFKSGWKSDSAEKRLSFIVDIDTSSAANQKILEKLAVKDIDASVRQAAMAKMTNLQALYDLWQSQKDDKDSQLVETAFRHLIQSAHLSASDFESFLANNPKASLVIAKYCPLEAIRKEILLALDEAEQADIISDITYSNTRIMLAEKIQSINSLEVARKNLKGKDKNAERIVRSKIDSIHAKQKLEFENSSLVKSIREKMESLARYVNWSDEIRVKFFNLTKSWDSLDFEPDEDEKKLYLEAFAKVEADVQHNRVITLAQQNQKKIINRLDLMCADIALYSLDKLLAESTLINDEHKNLSLQWDKEAETIPHSTENRDHFVKATKAIQAALTISNCVSDLRVVQSDEDNTEQKNDHNFMLNHHAKAILQAIKSSTWPSDFPALEFKNEAITEANSILNASKEAHQQARDALDKLHKRINRLFAAAQRGEINRAQRELAAIIKSTSNYEGGDRKKLDERIEEATDTVSKMGDWKDFAVEPKLIDLCEQMERLPELEKQSKNPSANNLAKKIKGLQEQWKTMANSDIADIHWPRFKQAADVAYEPCAEFFKKRREIQGDNLEKREPFIEQMKDLFESTDWDAKPDYKSVEDSISQIMQSWKKIKDVEHGRGQKQWDKLSKFKDQINQKLDIEYDKNIKAKHSLIEQLEQILALDVNEGTLDKLKFIQSKWKQIGLTRRKQDQTAWLKFKAVSDAVYAKIQGIRLEKRAAEDEQIDAYKQIHKQIHQLAKTTQDLSISDKEFEALESQYKDLPALAIGLPEKLIERLGVDYTKACDAYAGAKDRINKAKLDNELEVLTTKAQLCSELEQLPEKTDISVISELEDKINSLEISNKEYLKRFAKRLNKARESDREEFGKVRRLLLIEGEILLDVESPKEDKELRLQIQLERMKSDGLGNVSNDTAIALNEMKLEWLCMPGAEAKLQKAFDKRFEKLFKK